MAGRKGLKEKALISALDARGEVVVELQVSIDAYYDEGVEVIDSNEFRREQGVRS